jgi:hypothetical protein
MQTVEHDGLCALVTAIGDGDVVLRRESALAHSNALQAAFQHGPVLPLRFGTVLGDEAAVQQELLAPRTQVLTRRLDALEGLAEMQVKATYIEEPLLQEVLSGSPRLMQAATRIRQLPAAATHFERVALGEAIAGEVQARRQTDAQWLLDELSPVAVAVSQGECNDDHGVLNASFLVTAEGVPEFDAAVERMSERRAGEMQFRLIGPMPAHSFADQAWEEQSASPRSSQWD